MVKNMDYLSNNIEDEILENVKEDRVYVDDKRGWLGVDKIYVTDYIYIKIPTVGEVIKHEAHYYSIMTALTSTPFQKMVELDDMGVDYTTISDYQLFLMYFPIYGKKDLSLIFGNLDTSGYDEYINTQNDTHILANKSLGDNYIIDEFLYTKITDVIRKINQTKKVRSKPGNEEAKRYLLEKERKKMKRQARKPYTPYLENLVVALVNAPEFKYNYEETMNMSLYTFNKSLAQIQYRIAFDNRMIGVYSGTVESSKLSQKDSTWIQTDT